MAITIARLRGAEIQPYLSALAELRIRVFRDFPYLYDGNSDYESRYLETYAASAHSFFALALDDGAVVGCATGIPMADETDAFKAPFIEAGYDPERIFYFGESVLLPQYRGQGLGVRFFAEREAAARQLGGISHCCFCAVVRAADHPLRPADYQPLDDFWHKRGYRNVPELATKFAWKDVDQPEETFKTMSFWLKTLV